MHRRQSWDRAVFLASAYLLCGGISACVGQSANTSVDAEAELAAFALDNPECKLWTNWETMCSRTGENGEPYCITDPDRNVSPSAPFCTDASRGYDPSSMTVEQTESVLRFCDDVVEVDYPVRKGGEWIRERVNMCLRFESDRPFNGLRVAARRHPWCTEWSDFVAGSVVCRENSVSADGIPTCRNLAAEGYEHPTRLVCSGWKLPTWCHELRDFYDYFGGKRAPTDDAQDYRDGIYFDFPPAAAPVYGIQCRITKEAFEKME